MDGVVCTNCHTWLPLSENACPTCSTPIILKGNDKNVIDSIQANCLIHRYDGSDLLEPAVVLKEGKVNLKVAAKLKDYAAPVSVRKDRVYAFNQDVLSSIQALRNERTATIYRYDELIKKHWQNLKPYKP
ncbi:MAG: hypothetical protein LLG02_10465 [Pelosinus sp.]|nr:hypothetical protein [Pelosinus sp.]